MSDVELSVGDFVYQSDQELFLCVIGETENTYKFAVHGWREIDKNRLDGYLSHDNGKIYRQDAVTDIVENKGSDSEQENFEAMRQMFQRYDEIDLSDDGPHEEFSLDDS